MKVLLVNGSPHTKGCTYTALKEVAEELRKNGVDSEFFNLGAKPIAGCIGCGKCLSTGKCFRDDCVNDFIEIAKDFDGYIFGTPVHFASSSGELTSFMDRVFYGRSLFFANKPAATVVSCRRGGASTAFDQINKYYGISNMPVVGSQYWNQVHGNTPEEVLQDLEGLQTMRQLARNMAWMLECINAGRKAGVALPEHEQVIRTNFIR
jgi:multimeric flavodoxin WrbA